jgi:uncharacterized protein
MASLQEQLLKSGLVDKKKANRLKNEKQNHNKKVKHGLAKADNMKAEIAKQKAAKRARDIELNKIKQQAMQKNSERGMVKQMLEQHSVQDYSGELEYNYTYAGKIKKIRVNKEVRAGLIDGRIAICTLEDQTFIISKDKAERIGQVDDSVLALLNEPEAQTIEEDDPYADYQIPDDLMW